MEALVSNTDIYRNALIKTMNMPLNSDTVAFEWCGACITFEPHEHIEGTSERYVKHELDWYNSQDLSIIGHQGIEKNTIWKSCAADNGHINSNYGWCIFSEENGNQFQHAVIALKRDSLTRQACMYYTRPTIHKEWNDGKHAKHDMICTCYTTSLIRHGFLEHHVHMRSNDIWYGLRNDLAWQQHVQELLAKELNTPCGLIRWFVDSLHLYKRNVKQVKEWLRQ